MQIDPHFIIRTIKQTADQHYRDASESADRLAYQVGMLQGKIIELCVYLENAHDEIKSLQNDITHLKTQHDY